MAPHPAAPRLDGLAAELLELIAAQLTAASDLASLGCVCRVLARVVASGAVWRGALARAGGGAPRADGGCARRALRQLHTLDGAWWARERVTPRRAPRARAHAAAFAFDGGRALIVFGGSAPRAGAGAMRDCWALDVPSGEWFEVAPTESGPAARCFVADGGGGGVLRDALGAEFLVLHGGLRAQGYRDNETWLLGPLGPAIGARRWRWARIGGSASPQLAEPIPVARFHHRLTVLGGARSTAHGSSLVISGGHDYMLRPLLSVWVLSLRAVELCARTSAAPRDTRADGDAACVVPEPEPEPEPVERRVCERAARALRWASAESLARLPRTGKEPAPAERAHHAAAAWGRHLVVFGGERGRGRLLADTWLLDGTLGGWSKLAIALPKGGRSRAAAAVSADLLLICGGEALVAGAHGATAPVRDCWALNLATPGALGWTCLAHADAGAGLPSLAGGAGGAFVSASFGALHDGHTLLVFGGHAGDMNGATRDQYGDARHGFCAPAHTWAFRVATGADDAPVVARSARCSRDADGGLFGPAEPGAHVAFVPCGDRLLACGADESGDRLVVSELAFTR
ncbi:hypothetical protein KFE25_009424 [Diacronema lutheri]|uniref:F-box domain-containing protein n=2 Tax=Diacronema lutheri TaxID=2081491 RepID=A0A8J5XML8_DIALT|nr:hypothetical protein KFE25_009424 [Diacronema lutheri]